MKRFRYAKRTVALALALSLALLASPHPGERAAAAETAIERTIPTRLERQVAEWAKMLAKQQPFAEWQTSDIQIEALGPGTHSWLVLFTKAGRDTGYLVVHAVLDGTFRLGEYGTGPYSLFSAKLLAASLLEEGIVSEEQSGTFPRSKHYFDSFGAWWEVAVGGTTYWLDAKTAELLPGDPALLGHPAAAASWAQDAALNAAKPGIAVWRLNPTFDAYERLPWLTGEASLAVERPAALLRRLDGKKPVRYVTEPFGDAMLYAMPAIGYAVWPGGRIDIALDMNGLRMVPLDALRRYGAFYR